MDGIVTGLSSVIPIMPDYSIITDRHGVNKPAVEIMPIPKNNFMSEDATTEMLNTPFTLELDADGHHNGEAARTKTGTVGYQSNRTATADDTTNGNIRNEAYTLSLGADENTPLNSEIAREMSRLKSYEMIGKTAFRQAYRMNNNTGAAERLQSQPQDGDTPEPMTVRSQLMAAPEQIDEKMTNPLPEPSAQQYKPITQSIVTSYEDDTATLPLPQQVPQQPDTGPSRQLTVRTDIPSNLYGDLPEPIVRQDVTLTNSQPTVQFTASDIETIINLEPDLQQALLNMLNEVNLGITDKPPIGLPAAFNQNTIENPLAVPPDNQQALAPPDTFEQVLLNTQRLLEASVRRQAPSSAAEIAQAMVSPESAIASLLAEGLLTGKSQGVLAHNALRGNIINLQKVNELPYALYLFGNVTVNSRGDFDDEGDIVDAEKPSAWSTGPSEFLRVSEAIRMAAVLHNIYYGGSGRFAQETPWYTPYVKYAIQNGIIKHGEFMDYNEFATRAEVAYIFSGCVPSAEFPIINYVTDIVDVFENIGYGESIYLLFRAGVLTRSDKKGSFFPESMITRTEAATIIGRIATPDDRKRII